MCLCGFVLYVWGLWAKDRTDFTGFILVQQSFWIFSAGRQNLLRPEWVRAHVISVRHVKPKIASDQHLVFPPWTSLNLSSIPLCPSSSLMEMMNQHPLHVGLCVLWLTGVFPLFQSHIYTLVKISGLTPPPDIWTSSTLKLPKQTHQLHSTRLYRK